MGRPVGKVSHVFHADGCPEEAIVQLARDLVASTDAAGLEYLLFRAPAADMAALRAFEEVGFRVVDGINKLAAPSATLTMSAASDDSVEIGLAQAGEIDEIARHAVGCGTLAGAPNINHDTLAARGFGAKQIEAIEEALGSAFDIRFVFNKWTLGEAFCTETLGLDAGCLDDFSFECLHMHG